jgi:hypothetical protein
LCPLIQTFFLEELLLHPFVSQLGTNPLAIELGTGVMNLFTTSWQASILKLFVVNQDIYVTSGIQKEGPATCDELSALTVSQGMDFLNKLYSQARRWQVQYGNHKPFNAYCGTQHYLLLYHNSLLECGD